uniref:N-terminal asparagine amidohydrolase n=1 Tax=Caligus rogercresseyi TaxID=217165 RepID=C1BNF6_CALRO|nr:N-terminal asparagine amidohydrolase [Caligus rogercresseyi]
MGQVESVDDYAGIMVIQIISGRILTSIPESMSDFFSENPEICDSNLALTGTEHVDMWRDRVLFIKQRQQATSDIRENDKVRWIGSHAAMTCHILVMRHQISGVVSMGHFDNFCCWQFGEESSAHREGLDIMLHEIGALSRGYVDEGRIEVTVVGGYTDSRGDAAKNSMSLLRAIHESSIVLNLIHFCVGPYNTTLENGTSTAILKGICVDLKTQTIFPAVFNWGQFSDFKTQIEDRFRTRHGVGEQMDSEDRFKTRESTFKSKSLRNTAKRKKAIDSDRIEERQPLNNKDNNQSSKPPVLNRINDMD